MLVTFCILFVIVSQKLILFSVVQFLDGVELIGVIQERQLQVGARVQIGCIVVAMGVDQGTLMDVGHFPTQVIVDNLDLLI